MARLGEGPLYAKGGRIQIGRFDGTTVDGMGLKVHAKVWPDVIALLGITDATLPVHDPPVGWRGGYVAGIPVVVQTASLSGPFAVGYPPRDAPILDAEPGTQPPDEELVMIALALKNQNVVDVDGVSVERGVEKLIEALYERRGD